MFTVQPAPAPPPPPPDALFAAPGGDQERTSSVLCLATFLGLLFLMFVFNTDHIGYAPNKTYHSQPNNRQYDGTAKHPSHGNNHERYDGTADSPSSSSPSTSSSLPFHVPDRYSALSRMDRTWSQYQLTFTGKYAVAVKERIQTSEEEQDPGGSSWRTRLARQVQDERRSGATGIGGGGGVGTNSIHIDILTRRTFMEDVRIAHLVVAFGNDIHTNRYPPSASDSQHEKQPVEEDGATTTTSSSTSSVALPFFASSWTVVTPGKHRLAMSGWDMRAINKMFFRGTADAKELGFVLDDEGARKRLGESIGGGGSGVCTYSTTLVFNKNRLSGKSGRLVDDEHFSEFLRAHGFQSRVIEGAAEESEEEDSSSWGVGGGGSRRRLQQDGGGGGCQRWDSIQRRCRA
eukprot:GHVS01081343.1.p1 GENE.GHVS01081343.1~~GHVS01081343.1.p1  ORF type:complete len:403 (-),score=117.04 GHVS01081343.1:1297-2505(-)